jgi:hypothetical protein
LVESNLFSKLENLLRSQNFREADTETLMVVLKVANREKEGRLTLEDAKTFPYENLLIIDNLWCRWSNGKFGISVQQKIWCECGGARKYDADMVLNTSISFGDRVGWRCKGKWLPYDQLNFSLNAPVGHLPCGGSPHTYIWTMCMDMNDLL